jgi:hypothetical protein
MELPSGPFALLSEGHMTRGAEPRYISVREAKGEPTQVVLPYFRARKIAVMTLQSERDVTRAGASPR